MEAASARRSARSGGAAQASRGFKYPNEIGPGVHDIHSPRVPTLDEMHDLIALARNRLDDAQIWINPDTGAAGSTKSSVRSEWQVFRLVRHDPWAALQGHA
jgi:methionine synthase II (cobalamin-independent)